MKIRNGFVSNSSSSSFVIFKNKLSNEQIEKIKDHYSISRTMCDQGTSLDFFYDYDDYWSITETDLTIEGYTTMNNFDMYSYLEKFVGVTPDDIEWNY